MPIFYRTSTNQITLSPGLSTRSSGSLGKWVNPASGEERPIENFSGEQAKIILPSGWNDAPLYLRK